MTTTEAKTYPRSLYEARLDAACYAVSHDLHARLWRRFRLLHQILTGFAGSVAFGGWVANKAEFSGAAGLFLALMTAIDQAVDPSAKIAQHKVAAQRYTDLRRDSLANSKMDVMAFDARLEAIKAEDEAGIDALLVRAYNRVVVGAGRPDFKIPETFLQRLIAFFA